MIPHDLRVGEVAQIGQLAPCICGVAAAWVEQLEDRAVDERVGAVLAALHIAIHDTPVLAAAIHVVNLSCERLLR